MTDASITQTDALDMQVCVPKDWSDEQVVAFAEKHYPCGTSGGWGIRREGHELLAGFPERAQCIEHEDNCHIMLDA